MHQSNPNLSRHYIQPRFQLKHEKSCGINDTQ